MLGVGAKCLPMGLGPGGVTRTRCPSAPACHSAPTDDGRAFIEQYAGSRKFLVYE